MQTAFVTGGTGFLGLNLVRHLREAGWRVVAIHRESSDTTRLAALGAELRHASLDDVDSLTAAMPENVDAVFHVAGDISWWKLDRARQERVNVGGTRNVLGAATTRRAQCFVHTSSVAAFGIDHELVVETTPSTASKSAYGYVRTKWLGEEEVKKAAKKGLRAVIMNPTNIVGPFDQSSWGRLFFLLRDGKLPGIPPGSGTFCHSTDVARAHVEAVERGRPGEQYLLGGSDATYAELATIMAELVGVKPPKPLPAFALKAIGRVSEWASYVTRKEPDLTAGNADLVCSRWRVDSSKAVRELGYRAVPLRQMVEDSYRWLKDEKLI